SFAQCYSLEHISNFPESLTKLDDGAFDRCGNLCDSVVIPPLVTTIGERAFAGCHIPSVVISEGVTTIERGAFCSCPIGALHIPSTLVSISPENNAYGEGAFHNCTRLQSITVDEANPIYDSRGNCNALIETATNTLLKGCKNTVIPDDITIIGLNAFLSINELNTITIPNSVERLETSAFAGCNSLTTITLPSNISYIGIGALNCCGLTSIVSKSPTPPTAYNSQWQYGYDNSFMGVNRDIPIYIPVGTIDAYSNAAGWDYFNNFIESEINLEGEWYYEIQNDDSSITYQHLEYAADTTIGTERPKIIVRSNTIYDRDEITTEVTHEYLYEDNGKVYWWNKDLQEFTTLYDLTAEAGDEWEIKVGTESVTMHVDMVEYQELNGLNIRKLRISDENDLFSGDILCSFGHMTNFFPERLMNRNSNFDVNGLRCFWVEDALLYHNDDEDCDAIYSEIHGVDENGPLTGSETFVVYPNPTNNILFVETQNFASLPTPTYRIINLMGQTLLTGNISAETQQIDISTLPAGMYFISVDGQTVKFVVK
ncbi:MAG: leucine-rich repeat domain-containing protein, partial [Prevotella sp.]|nr:leucine-rich repeat domain-containing protein [Prevotella sp.]